MRNATYVLFLRSVDQLRLEKSTLEVKINVKVSDVVAEDVGDILHRKVSPRRRRHDGNAESVSPSSSPFKGERESLFKSSDFLSSAQSNWY